MTTAKSIRFPITPNLESLDGTLGRSGIRNGYAELVGPEEAKVFTRPSLDLSNANFAALGAGMTVTPDDTLYVISGGTIYTPAPSYDGTMQGTNSHFYGAAFCVTSYASKLYWLSGSANAAGPYFQLLTSAFTGTNVSTVGTGTFFGTATHINDFTVVNGSLCANAPQALYFSTDGTAWTTAAPPAAGPWTKSQALNGTLWMWSEVSAGAGLYGKQFSLLTATDAWVVHTQLLAGTTTGSIGFGNMVHGSYGGKIYCYGLTTGSENFGFSIGPMGTSTNTSGAGTAALTQVAAGLPWAGSISGTSNQRFRARFSEGASYMIMPWALNTATAALYISAGGNFSAIATWTNTALVGGGGERGFSQSLARGLYAGGQYWGFLSGDYLSSQDVLTYKIDLSGSGIIAGTGIGQAISAGVSGMTDFSYNPTNTTGFIKTELEAYTVSGGVATKVTDSDYPAETVRGAVYLNGYLYVMEPDGTIWNSNEDDFTTWNALNFITAEFSADGGVCLAKQGEYVIALGEFTTEAFYDAGNATGSPLNPVNAAVMLIGCAHANSVSQMETSLVWMAQAKGQGETANKGRFIAHMKGYGTYDRISTPDVERILDNDSLSEVYSAILTVSGHTFYVLTLSGSNLTLAFDFSTKLWYEWTVSTARTGTANTILQVTNGTAQARAVGHGFTSGDLVVVSGASPAAYNGTWNVISTHTNTYAYYAVSTLTASAAAGSLGTAAGWTQGAMDIAASCYFNNEQIVQLRTSGAVYQLNAAGTTDNGAPIDFRIRSRLFDGQTGREKFMNWVEVTGDKNSGTGLIRFTDDDYSSYTNFQNLDMNLKRVRMRRAGYFVRRAVEFRHNRPVRQGISAIEAEVEIGEK